MSSRTKASGYSTAAMFGLALLIVPAASATPGVQSTTNDNIQVIQTLKMAERVDQENEKQWSQEPLTQADFDLQEQTIEGLTLGLNKGEQVGSEEIEEATKAVPTPY